MAYLLISKPGLQVRRTRWLTDAHRRAARAGRLVVVDMKHQLKLDARGWRDIPPRRGEPRVLLVEGPDEDELLDDFFF
ncbi:MAG: hypothetical protein QOE90_2306 [Thermoplasmata archaeon]|jgi:hypothetical protein|nr:hypothetical protein [Thermoplasmata archaeon]